MCRTRISPTTERKSVVNARSEEHTSELQSQSNLVCRLLLEKKKQTVSIRRGLKFACTRWKAVLMWTLFAGLVGLIIQTIEQRLEIVGRLLARFIGLAWSIASVFVIPIIVREEQDANPLNMLKRSAGILK